MRILGLSGHYHDSAAALLVDGKVVAAAQQERFSRRKHDPAFPADAARWCLAEARMDTDALDAIAWYEKPFRKFDRLLGEWAEQAPRGVGRFLHAAPLWLRSRLWVRAEIERRLDTCAPVLFAQHHESHAAAAFGPSPFDEAAILTLDGVGEWTTNAVWVGRGRSVIPVAELRYPHSLGLLFSAFTSYCGFQVNDGEYKLMGLAPYGKPRFAGVILERLIALAEDGSYALAPEYFDFRVSDRMTSDLFHALFGGPPRDPGSPLTSREADLASSIQAVTEEIVLRQARWARERTGARDVCLGGGVALNCVANGRLARERIFDRLWVQPAAGDAGGAVGAAYAMWFRRAAGVQRARMPDDARQVYLGPEYGDGEIQSVLDAAGCRYARRAPAALVEEVADALARGEVVGLFQGRMEFGPRALGNRSILADPRDPGMQRRVNAAVKFREGFRPFAPVVREEDCDAWFDLPARSPFMLLTGAVHRASPSSDRTADLAGGAGPAGVASRIPAVTHVDASARVQTLAPGSNPLLEAILVAFGARTGCPVLLNTSFNAKDEPIVATPRDAYACFCRTGIELLAAGPFLVRAGDKIPLPAERPAPSRPERSRAALELAITAVAASALATAGAPRASIAGLAFGASLAGARAFAPRARAAVERVLGAAGRGLGAALVLPLFAVAFALVLSPLGLLARLRRAWSPPAPPAWLPPAEPDHDPTKPF